ncbi:MAG: ADYC domain-containing protein [Kofleriaceae bacterium]
MWLAIMMVTACGAPAGDDDFEQTDGREQLSGPNEGMEAQGRHLLGKHLDLPGPNQPTYLSVLVDDVRDADGDRVPRGIQFHGSASLSSGKHVGADPWFDGVVLGVAGGGEMRLHVSRGGSDVTFYNVELRETAADPWVDACASDYPDGVPADVHADAVPLAGVWQRGTALHVADPTRITFACATGVAYKCTSWTYLAGSDDTSLLWRAHQACTRMTRGDYCANDRSHTREGTQIGFRDFAGVTGPPPLRLAGVKAWPPAPDDLYFEAAWNDGVKPASCLSRVRWQSLPLGSACGGDLLTDPRLDTRLPFCEDVDFPTPAGEVTGPILFNLSRYSDLRMHVWRNGDDLVSTVRGYHEPAGPVGTYAPFAGVIGEYTHVVEDGMLIRSLREVVDPAEVEEVRLYRSPDGLDRVIVNAANAPAGYETPTGGPVEGFEGYVYRLRPNDQYVELKLYRHAVTGDHVSSTLVPADPMYAFVARIGFTLAGEAGP